MTEYEQCGDTTLYPKFTWSFVLRCQLLAGHHGEHCGWLADSFLTWTASDTTSA